VLTRDMVLAYIDCRKTLTQQARRARQGLGTDAAAVKRPVWGGASGEERGHEPGRMLWVLARTTPSCLTTT